MPPPRDTQRRIITVLGAAEQERIDAIAVLRYQKGSRSGRQKHWEPDHIFDPKTRSNPLKQEREGIIAEVVCERVLPVELNTVYGESDRGIDFVFTGGPYQGQTGDAKFTRTAKGVLFFNTLSEFRADLAVLILPFVRPEWSCGLEDHVYQVAGWITRSDFKEQHTVRDLGYGPRLCVAQAELGPGEALQ